MTGRNFGTIILSVRRDKGNKRLFMMKIAIVGATGSFGKGLALRWAGKHAIYIGSRSAEKGQQRAEEYQRELHNSGLEARIVGVGNMDAVRKGDVIVLAVKFEHLQPLIADAAEQFRGKIVISPIVALKKERSFQYAPPPEGSAALLVQEMLPAARVIAALHTIPADKLQKRDMILEGDVPVCGNDPEAKQTVIDLIREIERLNPIDAGPLEVSRLIEPLVPLILNVKQHSLKRNASIKFI